MKTYTVPQLTDYGSVADVTATLGAPFSGDVTFDVDGNVIEVGMGESNQCLGTENNESCFLADDPL